MLHNAGREARPSSPQPWQPEIPEETEKASLRLFDPGPKKYLRIHSTCQGVCADSWPGGHKSICPCAHGLGNISGLLIARNGLRHCRCQRDLLCCIFWMFRAALHCKHCWTVSPSNEACGLSACRPMPALGTCPRLAPGIWLRDRASTGCASVHFRRWLPTPLHPSGAPKWVHRHYSRPGKLHRLRQCQSQCAPNQAVPLQPSTCSFSMP